MGRGKKRSARQMWLRFLFVIYGAAMLWLLFGQRIEKSIFFMQLPLPEGAYRALVQGSINLTPMLTVERYWHILKYSTDRSLLNHAAINLVGNVVMFIPLGIFFPGIFMKKPNVLGCLFAVACTIVLVEFVQLVTLLGSLDVDDLILNLSGAFVGYVIWRIRNKPRKR